MATPTRLFSRAALKTNKRAFRCFCVSRHKEYAVNRQRRAGGRQSALLPLAQVRDSVVRPFGRAMRCKRYMVPDPYRATRPGLTGSGSPPKPAFSAPPGVASPLLVRATAAPYEAAIRLKLSPKRARNEKRAKKLFNTVA